jgi:hypothetical protein
LIFFWGTHELRRAAVKRKTKKPSRVFPENLFIETGLPGKSTAIHQNTENVPAAGD